MPLRRRCAGIAGLIGAILAAPQVAPAQPFADEHIRGTVETFDGQEQLTLRDDRGFQDDVAIGPDTRIVPRGTRLVPGMRIAITGYNGGNWFDAISIQVLQSSRPSSFPSYAVPPPAEAVPPSADAAVPTYADPGPARSDVSQRGEPIILRATWAPYPVAIDDPALPRRNRRTRPPAPLR